MMMIPSRITGAILPSIVPALHDAIAVEQVLVEFQVHPVVHFAHPLDE